jgi:hypothetical protein
MRKHETHVASHADDHCWFYGFDPKPSLFLKFVGRLFAPSYLLFSLEIRPEYSLKTCFQFYKPLRPIIVQLL